MSKYVRESSAAKQISAYVILRSGKEVARVLAHHTGARCLVNVFQRDAAAAHSAAAAKAPDLRPFIFQSATASGGGYDRFVAALSGLWIDGRELTDHCGRNRKPPKGRKLWPRDSKAPRGWHFANFITQGDESGWLDCYRIAGLDYLRAFGYDVLQVL